MDHKLENDSAKVSRHLRAWRLPSWRDDAIIIGLALAETLLASGFALGLSSLLAHHLALKGLSNIPATPLELMIGSLLLQANLNHFGQKYYQARALNTIKYVRQSVVADLVKSRGLGVRYMPQFQTLIEDSEALEGYYARYEPAQTQAIIAPLLILIFIASRSMACALVLAVTLLPFIAFMVIAGIGTSKAANAQMDALAKLSNLFSDRIGALPLILSYKNAERQTKSVAKAALSVAIRTLEVLKIAFLGSAILEFFSALSIAMIAVYCGFYLLKSLPFHVPDWLDFKGNVFEAAFFCLMMSVEFYAPMRRLSAAYHEKQKASAACARLLDLQDMVKPEFTESLWLSQPPEIEFKAVSCQFMDDPDFCIGPVSFKISPGTVTAIIGESGSGKSTLLRLLLGIGKAQDITIQGEILINGQPLLSPSDLSASLSWLSQTTPLISGTILDNIRLSNRNASEAEVWKLVKLVGLSEALSKRQMGLYDLIDERGSGLSGGERRKIGLARAMLKNAPILILDEPTSDIDIATEAKLLKPIKAACTGRTVLLATHSKALANLADCVVEL